MPGQEKKEHRSPGGFQGLDEIGDSLSANHVYSSPRMQKRRSLSVRAREAGAEVEESDALPGESRLLPHLNPLPLGEEAREAGAEVPTRCREETGSTHPLTPSLPGRGNHDGAQSRHVGTPLHGGREDSGVSTRPDTKYAELHCHSNYSFKEGASYTSELLVRAKQLGLAALAITDHDGMSGVMEFAQAAKSVGIKAIIGAEVTLTGGHHLTLLAESAEGYSNICRLVTRAHMDPPERNKPALDPALLPEHSAGVICLSGCRRGEISELVLRGELNEAHRVAARYRDWFGADNFFLELQQNLVQGDTERNRLMASIGMDLGIPVVAANNVHYHARERSQLNDVLVAIQHNKSLEETHRERRPNDQFYLKPPGEMADLFAAYPEAIENTVRIADRCDFELTSARVYDFPGYDVPEGYTQAGWLRELCEEAAVRRYGSVTPTVRERLDEEMRLLEKHNLAGFVLQYYDIIKIAREVQEDLGLVERGLPLEENPPGRGRGSSVAMLVGYLIGLSHIDPLRFGLKLDRFLPDDEMSGPPDIDLDFPRDIREELILRVHERWGFHRAVLTGMISTYRVKGAIRDVGMALGLPQEDLDKLCKRVDGHAGVRNLPAEMRALPEYRDRVDLPIWQDLLRLSQELGGFPKYLAQHPGGMILSARPLSETVPLQRSAINGRYICQWDKDSADDAGFVKIDFLALGALSQMNRALDLIARRTEERIDLSRIDFEDRDVYAMLHRADTVGVFQVESAAQMQTITRIRPKNLTEMAWEVGAVRPGVGVNDGVAMLIRRHTGQEPDWEYDHPLEAPALERTLGVVLYQDQLMELGMHVAGLSAAEADRMRRAFSRRNRDELVPMWKERFLEGAQSRGVPEEAALKIFGKFHGEFQFPESHAFAFGVTAYQMSWLKHYYPLEFYVGLFNEQPMGFYNLETLKEDARRHGVQVVNPDVNRSGELAVIDNERLRLGLMHVATVRQATADVILAARERHGPFASVADFMRRTGVLQEQLDNLADAGAFDSLTSRGVAVAAPAMPPRGGAVVAGPVPLAGRGVCGDEAAIQAPGCEDQRNGVPIPSPLAGEGQDEGLGLQGPRRRGLRAASRLRRDHPHPGPLPSRERGRSVTPPRNITIPRPRPATSTSPSNTAISAPTSNTAIPAPHGNTAIPAPTSNTAIPAPTSNTAIPAPMSNTAISTPTSNTAILRRSKDGGEVAEGRTTWQPADDRRRDTKWEVGLRYRPVGRQLAFDLPVEQDMVALPEQSEWEVMTGEYRTMGLHPRGHVMAKLRPHLPRGVIRSVDIADCPEGASIRVAGVVIRRQRPLAKAVFITLEDEFGHSPLVIWPQVYAKLRRVARAPVLLARGKVSHRDGTLNVVVTGLEPLEAAVPRLKSKDWG